MPASLFVNKASFYVNYLIQTREKYLKNHWKWLKSKTIPSESNYAKHVLKIHVTKLSADKENNDVLKKKSMKYFNSMHSNFFIVGKCFTYCVQ